MQTKIYYISDLHLDCMWHYHKSSICDAMFYMLPEGDTSLDILVIAGDLCNDGTKSLSFNKESWLKVVSQRFRDIVLVFGNHDFYNTSFDVMENKFTELLCNQNITNVHVLNDRVWFDDISGVLFVGGTLWTDFDKQNPLAMYQTAHFMNDYRYIRTAAYQKITPQHTLKKHLNTKAYIEQVAASNQYDNICVVTHCLPSYQLIREKCRGEPLNCCYASELDDLMYLHDNIKYWVAGHTHDSSSVTVGGCQCVVNPYGYNGDNRYFDRNAHFVVNNA